MEATTHKELIDYLVNKGVLHTPHIIDAFYQVNRVDFVLPEYMEQAYQDRPLPIRYDLTISQPTTVALMMERLQPQVKQKILDIGSGSGWTTTLLAQIVGEEGYVYGIEKEPELVTFGQDNIEKYSYENLEILEVQDQLGLPGKSFDRILVSAAAEEFPQELLQQLNIGGVIVIPIQDQIWRIIKISSDQHDIKKFYGFRFVPLI